MISRGATDAKVEQILPSTNARSRIFNSRERLGRESDNKTNLNMQKNINKSWMKHKLSKNGPFWTENHLIGAQRDKSYRRKTLKYMGSAMYQLTTKS